MIDGNYLNSDLWYIDGSRIEKNGGECLSKIKVPNGPFTCPHCGYTDKKYQNICPACGRPYIRDYIDTQMHPGDPNPTGVYAGRFWAWVFLVMVLLGLVLWICGELGIFQ